MSDITVAWIAVGGTTVVVVAIIVALILALRRHRHRPTRNPARPAPAAAQLHTTAHHADAVLDGVLADHEQREHAAARAQQLHHSRHQRDDSAHTAAAPGAVNAAAPKASTGVTAAAPHHGEYPLHVAPPATPGASAGFAQPTYTDTHSADPADGDPSGGDACGVEVPGVDVPGVEVPGGGTTIGDNAGPSAPYTAGRTGP